MNHLSVKTKIFFRKIIVLMTTFGKVFQTQDMEMRGYLMISLLFFKRQDCRFCSTQWENGFENKSIAFPLIEMKIYLNFTPIKVENCQPPPAPFFFSKFYFLQSPTDDTLQSDFENKINLQWYNIVLKFYQVRLQVRMTYRRPPSLLLSLFCEEISARVKAAQKPQQILQDSGNTY